MGIELPKKKHVAEEGWPDYATWLVFGAPKIGKTTFAAQWPECLIVNMEPRGTRYVEGAYTIDVTSLEELRELFKTLRSKYNEDERPYETIALDTIDIVKDWVYEEIMAELGVQEMGQADGGADWIRGRRRTLNIISTYAQLPVNLLVNAHSKPVQVNKETVGATIDLPGSLARCTLGAVENILYCTVERDKRKLIFQPNTGIDTGSHHPTLNKAGSCDLSYDALRGLFK